MYQGSERASVLGSIIPQVRGVNNNLLIMCQLKVWYTQKSKIQGPKDLGPDSKAIPMSM